MCRLLKEAQATQVVLDAAAKFECDFCRQRGHAAMHRTSQVPHPKEKWEVVSVDTFWWYSPHRDEKGNPVVQAVGLSIMDELTDYHTGVIVRTGLKNIPNLSGAEFRKALSQTWLKQFPQPRFLRMDDEGAFRDDQTVSWLESQGIQISYAAGEAAWQVGKHSRHLATLKETMSLLATEKGPEMSVDELLSLSIAAKNRLHQIKGYSPNQWSFGSERNSVESWLEFGDHLPTQSRRETDLTFEQNLENIQKAKQAFLQADARRRLLRAEKGKARRAENFDLGQLVYFYRKGKGSASNRHPGWYGPARVVGVEKMKDDDETKTQGSIVWVSHGTTLYRCAPEQLRKVTKHLQELNDEMHPQSVFQDLSAAGNSSKFKDISKEFVDESPDFEIHDEEPPSPGNFGPSPADHPALIRARFKQKERYRHVDRSQPSEAHPEAVHQGESARGRLEGAGLSDGASAMPKDVHQGSRRWADESWPPCPGDVPQRLPEASGLPDLAHPASPQESKVHEHPGVCREGDSREGRGTLVKDRSVLGRSPSESTKEDFWKNAADLRERQRVGRLADANSEEHRAPQGRSDVDDGHHDGSHHQPQGSTGPGAAVERRAPVSSAPEHRSDPRHPDESGRARSSTEPHGGAGSSVVSGSRSNLRSRSPSARIHFSQGQYEIYMSSQKHDNEDEHGDEHVDDDECIGSAHVDHSMLQSHEDTILNAEDLRLGCFAKVSQWPESSSVDRSQTTCSHTSRHKDNQCFFSESVSQNRSCVEIVLNVAPRDVHQGFRNGKKEWKLNEKPKRRAEVQFRTLTDDDKLDFLRPWRMKSGHILSMKLCPLLLGLVFLSHVC